MHSFLIKTCFYALTNVHILHVNINDLNNHAHTLNPNLVFLFRFLKTPFSYMLLWLFYGDSSDEWGERIRNIIIFLKTKIFMFLLVY